MDINNKISAALKNFQDKIAEQEWFRELKAKWDELDPESRRNARIGILASTAGLFGLITLSMIWSVSAKRSELNDKQEILSSLKNASEEIRVLRRSNHPAASDALPNWPAYLKGKATTSGMDPSALTVSPEKKGNSGTSTVETMFEVQLKHINVRQLMQFAFYVENGDQPVKLKNLKIDTEGGEGYLTASLDLSTFSLKKDEK